MALKERLERNQKALEKKRRLLALTARDLSMLNRKKRAWFLLHCGCLFERAGLFDPQSDKLSFDEGVVYGFLCALKQGALTAEEIARYQRIGQNTEKEKGGMFDGYGKDQSKD